MANSVPIPQDIIDNIIEAVGDDPPLLKKCALVSSSFLLPSRKRLFSNISLGHHDHDDRKACKRLHRFLVENPDIQSFVRSIAITGNEILESHSESLIAILRLQFCCLESFSISSLRYRSNWNDFSSELNDALSTIIHSSTLKTLSLEGLINAPIKLFHGVHLTKLELRSFLPDDFKSERPRLLSPAAASEGATSHTVIDQCVWTFKWTVRSTRFPASAYFSLIWDMEGLTEPIFLPFMCRLRVLEIHVNPQSPIMNDFANLSILMRSLHVSLTSPATLEHIKINIVFDTTDININYHDLFDDLRVADVWSHLDSIITHPTGSRLQRVDINMKCIFAHSEYAVVPDKTEVMEPVLDALPLLREKGILFVDVYW